MRQLLVVACLFVPVFAAKEPKNYDLTANVIATRMVPVSSPHVQSVNTDTTCNTAGVDTNCESTSTPRVTGGETTLIQVIEIGKTRYTAACHMGHWQAFAMGTSRGTGNNVTTGCQILPGQYKARMDESGLYLQVQRGKKLVDLKMNILESETIAK